MIANVYIVLSIALIIAMFARILKLNAAVGRILRNSTDLVIQITESGVSIGSISSEPIFIQQVFFITKSTVSENNCEKYDLITIPIIEGVIEPNKSISAERPNGEKHNLNFPENVICKIKEDGAWRECDVTIRNGLEPGQFFVEIFSNEQTR